VANDEERIDENIAGDRDVNSGCVVQLESRLVENALERVHRIYRQTDCKNGQYLHRNILKHIEILKCIFNAIYIERIMIERIDRIWQVKKCRKYVTL